MKPKQLTRTIIEHISLLEKHSLDLEMAAIYLFLTEKARFTNDKLMWAPRGRQSMVFSNLIPSGTKGKLFELLKVV